MKPEDVEAVVRIYFESAEHHRAIEPARYIIPDREGIVARYAAPEGTVLVAVDEDGRVMGFAELRLQESPDAMHARFTFCHIVEIAVDARMRGRGIGEELIRAAEEWGRGAGAEYASLEHLSTNGRAAALYERLGYREASIVRVKPLTTYNGSSDLPPR